MAMDQPQSEDDGSMGFLDHLEEFRRRLIRSAMAVLVATIALFSVSKYVFEVVIFGPSRPSFISYTTLCKLGERFDLTKAICIEKLDFNLINTQMLGQFTADIQISIIGGIVLAFPVIFYQIWLFLKPGLRPHEIKSMRGVNAFTGLLFFLGIVFGYFIIVPLSVNFLANYDVGMGNVDNEITLMSYVKLISGISMAGGLMFQLPILTLFLTKMGLVTPEMMKKYRKHALVGVLVLSALITPPDIFSQVLIAIPVLLLYEISIIISRRIYKNQQKALATM